MWEGEWVVVVVVVMKFLYYIFIIYSVENRAACLLIVGISDKVSKISYK